MKKIVVALIIIFTLILLASTILTKTSEQVTKNKQTSLKKTIEPVDSSNTSISHLSRPPKNAKKPKTERRKQLSVDIEKNYELLMEENREIRHFEKGIHWISFPRLKTEDYEDALWASGNTASSSKSTLDNFGVSWNGTLDLVYLNTNNFTEDDLDYFDGSDWLLETPLIQSKLGYKLTLSHNETYEMSGPRLPDDTSIVIECDTDPNNADFYWLGFWKTGVHYDFYDFIPEGIIDDVSYFQHKNWYITRTGQPGDYEWDGPTNAYIDYGEMVVVKYDDEITWPGYETDSRGNKTGYDYSSEYFVYEEQLDYLPITFELPENCDATEVGVYINNVCKGFGQVDNGKAYIRAYVLEEQDPENAQLQFVYYNGSRSDLKKATNYRVIDQTTGLAYSEEINLDNPLDIYYISSDGSIESFDDVYAVNNLSLDAYPNPFVGSTMDISYITTKDMELNISIYNVRGQKVRTLFSGESKARNGQLKWDGRDYKGQNVSNGIYFIKMNNNGHTTSKKVVVVK